MAPLCYRRHRFSPEIIQHAIWLYLRFTLSYRDVEEIRTTISSRCQRSLGRGRRWRSRRARAQPRGKRGFSTLESRCGIETDSPLASGESDAN
jgi:hypothetical protein